MITELKKYRNSIDKIDNEIVGLLKKRLLMIKKIDNYKKHNKLKITNAHREKEVLIRIKNKSSSPKEKNYLTGIYESVITQSRKMQ